jgi:hypothetical protein
MKPKHRKLHDLRSMKRMNGRCQTPRVTGNFKYSFIRSYLHILSNYPLISRNRPRSPYEPAALTLHICGQRTAPPLNGGDAGEIVATAALPHIAAHNR